MKKLFNTGSLVEIDNFSLLRINGPFTLLTLGPDHASIKTGEYIIEAIGEDLTVDTLSEEVAVFTFTSITKMTVEMADDRNAAYES